MPPEQQRELVLSLERGTLRLTQLIDNLLESVRIESGQLAIRSQSVDLADGGRGRARADRLAAGAARPDARGLDSRRPAARRRRRAAPDAGVREPHRQREQVRAGVEHDPRRRQRAAASASRRGSRTKAPGLPEGDGASIFDRFRRGPDVEPEPGGLGLGLVDREIHRRAPRRHDRGRRARPKAAPASA